MKSIQIIITGLVQGVFFRHYTQQKARELKLTGYVKNMHDGSVYIEVTGTDETLKQFITWCHTGSPQSIVEKVEVTEMQTKSFSSFTVQK